MNKYIISLLIWIVLFGCTTQNKAIKFFDKKKPIAAKYCADRFPIKETIDTIIIEDTAVIEMYEREFDYMYRYIDSLLSIKVDTQSRKDIMYIVDRLPAPPPVTKYVTKIVENTARYQVILDSCSKYSDSLTQALAHKDKQIEQALSVIKHQTEVADKYKRQRNRNLWWILLLLAIVLRKPIYRGIRRVITKI